MADNSYLTGFYFQGTGYKIKDDLKSLGTFIMSLNALDDIIDITYIFRYYYVCNLE